MNQKETIDLARALRRLETFQYANSHPIVVDGQTVRADEFVISRTTYFRAHIADLIRPVVERYAAKHKINLQGQDITR